MPGSFADFLEDEILDHVFAAQVYTPPVTHYVALYTVAPTDAGGGTEVAGNGYARVAVTANLTNWPASVGGAIANGVAFTFPPASGGNWGTIVAMAILDAATAGNFMGWADLTTDKPVNDGGVASFEIADIDILFLD